MQVHLHQTNSSFLGASPKNIRAEHTLVMPLITTPNNLTIADRQKVNQYRQQRINFDFVLEHYWISGEKKCAEGDFSRALSDYQSILDLMKGEEVDNLTQHQKILLAKSYVQSARILNVGTVEDEKIALEHLDKALDLVPDFHAALELKRAILADNAISPMHLNEM